MSTTRRLRGCWAFLGLCASAVLARPAAAAVTITNSDVAGNQVSRFDVEGNALDAHDGALVRFGDSYYLYGTSYGCGYEYRGNSTFCGFRVYSSPDLVHFTDRGLVVPAADCQYCFRPHVIYNEKTQKYVLWSDGGGGTYRVYTSSSPTGAFSREADPTLAVGGAVDEALFLDDDGSAYLIHNTTQVANSLTADMVVEPLSADFLSTTGASSRLGLGDVEAFAVFKRDGVYHALMSDPSCAYCSGGTGEMTATNMLGPWVGAYFDPKGVSQTGTSEPRQRARQVNADNCGGQPLAVLPVPRPGGGADYYFVSDRWNARAPNESLANFFIGPLSFDAGGVLQKIDCVATFDAQLEIGSSGAYLRSPLEDQSSGFDGFRHYCDIASNVQRQQTFIPSRSNTLTALSVTAFQSGHPNAPLQIDLLDETGVVLATESRESASIAWAPQVLTLTPRISVSAGHAYTVRLHSATTQGCYGFEYNDSNVYAGGRESYSVDAGMTFTAEPLRDLKFSAEVRLPSSGAAGEANAGAPGAAGIGGAAPGGGGGASALGGARAEAGGALAALAGDGGGPPRAPRRASADKGCGCGVAGGSPSGSRAATGALLGLGVACRRRRARGSRTRV